MRYGFYLGNAVRLVTTEYGMESRNVGIFNNGEDVG